MTLHDRGAGWPPVAGEMSDRVRRFDWAATPQTWTQARLRGMLDVEYRVRRAADDTWLWHHIRSVPIRHDTDLRHGDP